MTTIKLTTNKAFQAMCSTVSAFDVLAMIVKAERIAPVSVHSHGGSIDDVICSLESALELAKDFQRDVQGR